LESKEIPRTVFVALLPAPPKRVRFIAFVAPAPAPRPKKKFDSAFVASLPAEAPKKFELLAFVINQQQKFE
jgi:hypothetical protein